MPPSRARALGFLFPAALAITCAGNGMGFFDSPELASSGAGLGVTHPPGHPLWVALSALLCLLPIASVPFRIALGEALCLGLMGWLCTSAALRLFERLARGHGPRLGPWVALAAGLTATVGTGVFRQATRVEVYALAGALAAVTLAAALHDARPPGQRLRVAVLALGLGVANHHFIALTTLPLALWLGIHWWRAQRPRWVSVLSVFALGALGLIPYVLLPLRADALASLPRVRSLGDFLEVASARVFAKNTGLAVPGSVGSRVVDVLDWLGDSLTPVGLLFVAGGCYVALRTPGARSTVARLGLLTVCVGGARTWLGFVRDNPDAAGYLVPAVLATAIASVGFSAGAVRALSEAPAPPVGPSPGARRLLSALLLGGPLVLPLALAARSVFASGVDRAAAPETLAGDLMVNAPPRAVLFVYDPPTIFRLRHAMLVDGERPDLTVVPVPLLGYPGMVDALLERDRALRPVLSQYLLRPERGVPSWRLSALAVERTVLLEPDPRNVRENVSLLLPRGMLAQVMPEPTTLAGVRGAAVPHFDHLDQLAVRLARDPVARRLTDEILLWHAYTDALLFAARGARAEAHRAVAVGLRIEPTARELTLLRDALAAPGDGPLDVTPFLPSEQ